MNCIAVYHVPFEDLGTFAAPVIDHGYEVTYRHAGSAPLSEAEWRDTDLIIVLGGPIGANDTAAYPWLDAEIRGLQSRLKLKRPTLGICLGAQLMAVALGGKVMRRTVAGDASAVEIGWSALKISAGAGLLERLRGVPVLHWHGDNIVLPKGMAPAAATEGTPCQAFHLETHALGIQFHAEFEAGALEQWLTGHAVELRHAGVDLGKLREETLRHGRALDLAGKALMRDWLSGLAATTQSKEHPNKRNLKNMENNVTGKKPVQELRDPVLYHDGCNICLDIARALSSTMPSLKVVDLKLHPEMKSDAAARGIVALPCLVIEEKVLPIAPHSELADIGTTGH